jgi:hypothetical protein
MKHDKQYWIDKLESAKKNQIKLANEIANIEYKLDGPAKKAHCDITNGPGIMVCVCYRAVRRMPQYYRWAAFAKLVQLRQKLRSIQTTKIPYYMGRIQFGSEFEDERPFISWNGNGWQKIA